MIKNLIINDEINSISLKPKPQPKPDESDPYVEVKMYVEKSEIDNCGGINSAILIAYWALVDNAHPNDGDKDEIEI